MGWGLRLISLTWTTYLVSTYGYLPELSVLVCRKIFPPSRPFLLHLILANTITSYRVMHRWTRHHPPVAMEHHIAPPLLVFHWNLAFDDHMLGTVYHGLKVAVCPHARSDDLMILIQPIIASLVPNPVPDSSRIVPLASITLTRSSMQQKYLSLAIILNSSWLLCLRKLSTTSW